MKEKHDKPHFSISLFLIGLLWFALLCTTIYLLYVYAFVAGG